MTPEQIRSHYVKMQKEVNNVSLLSAASDKVGTFNMIIRFMNDLCVLGRELADAVIALDRKSKS